MTSTQLNLKLIESFPQIKDVYLEETSWQDGDETGSHVVYADIFVPFIREQIVGKNEQMLIKIFNYIEGLLNLKDEYANKVVALSVVLKKWFFGHYHKDAEVNKKFTAVFDKIYKI